MITMAELDSLRARSSRCKEQLRTARAQAWETASGMEGPTSPIAHQALEVVAEVAELQAEAAVLEWIAQGCREHVERGPGPAAELRFLGPRARRGPR